MSSIRPSSSSPPGTPEPRSTLIVKESRAAEDYLKVIYGHTEWQPDPITPSQLAARLGLAPSTVTEMVKKLVVAGYVEHAPYSAVRLTASGRAEALRMVRRHRLVETWLVQRYGYGWDEVHDEAEILEHALSDRLLDEIDRQLGRPTRDPHGDPIPSADGTVEVPDAVPLSSLSAGTSALVARISDRDPAVLQELDGIGIGLGAEITAGDVAHHVADAIWVIRGATRPRGERSRK